MPLTDAYFVKLDIQDEIVGFLKSSYTTSHHMVFLVEVNYLYGSIDADDDSFLLVDIVALLVDDEVPLRGRNDIRLACLLDFSLDLYNLLQTCWLFSLFISISCDSLKPCGNSTCLCHKRDP